MKEPRHAYLIMAHKADHILTTLLKMLDSVYNDIYIHYDLKSHDYKHLHSILGGGEIFQIDICQKNKDILGPYLSMSCNVLTMGGIV